MANVAASTTPNKESPTPNISSATENGGDGESIENDQTSEAHAVAGAVDASPAVPAASDLESVEVDEDEEDDSTSKLEFSASCFPALMGNADEPIPQMTPHMTSTQMMMQMTTTQMTP